MNKPLTHNDYWKQPAKLRPFVQVRKAGQTFCAQIFDCYTTHTGLELWQVEPIDNPYNHLTVPASSVRPCGVLDGCVCVPHKVSHDCCI